MMNVIELKGVEKIYRMGKVNVHALRGIDMIIRKGERVAILGPSGCGKSTLLDIMGLIDRPTKGKVLLEGKNVSKYTADELARIRNKKIGFVFQFFYLLPTLTAIENIQVPMIFAGAPKDIREKKAWRLIGIVGMKKRALHRPMELSGGERQRIAIARALANDPEIILADEPTGNLDTKTGKEIVKLLIGIGERIDITLVMVTHDKRLAKNAERILYIKDGRIIKEEKGKNRWR